MAAFGSIGSLPIGKESIGGVGSSAPAVPPEITGVTGTISDGQAITVSGNTFGAGCANVLFEDFSGISANDETITTSNTNFDETSTFWLGKSRTDSRSGTYSVKGYTNKTIDATSYAASINGFLFGARYTEAFVCFSVKNPTGTRMPGITTGNNAYPSNSAWKTAWLLDVNSTDDDLVVPTMVAAKWSLAGNDLGVIKDGLPGNNPTWWTFGEWNTMATWLRAGDTPEIDNGDYWFEAFSPSGSRYEVESAASVIFANGTAPYGWDRIHIPGWMHPLDSDVDAYASDVESLYDDIYVAYGANAGARVQLGNNVVFEDCTRKSICDYSAWSATSISATVREGDVDLTGDVWLFVVNADNTVLDSFKVNTAAPAPSFSPSPLALAISLAIRL